MSFFFPFSLVQFPFLPFPPDLLFILSFLFLYYSLPVTAELWQLFAFHFSPPQQANSRAPGALFKQTGGRVVRRGWRHAITNHRLLAVAGTWCTGPRYGGERGPNRDLPLWFPWQPDINISRSEVRSDGRWELMYCATWLDGLTCTRWNHRGKNGKPRLFLVRKITRKANAERMRNKIINETKDEEIVLW